MYWRLAACFSLVAVLPVIPPRAEEETMQNLIPNGSFETEAGESPAGWTTRTWGGQGELKHARAGRTGKRSAVISSKTGADISWQVHVPVQPYARYRLSGWIRTENVAPAKDGATGRGALLNVHNIQPAATPAVTGTTDWTEVEVLVDTGTEDVLQINCLFGGWGLSTGKAWYDDLRLELVGGMAWEPHLAIDVRDRGHPISKYIYGQFIEHLGRCIYGGIWAEILEDRKFFYPITPDYDPYGGGRSVSDDLPFPVVAASPWRILGPAASARMLEEDPFAGTHTPLLSGGTAIEQTDLALVEGKDYVGYVWLKRAGADAASATVTLSHASGKTTVSDPGNDYTKHTLRFHATSSTVQASLTISIEDGACLVGTVSLMPADNVEGMRADTLALLKELNAPVYRWPGGNFVSGYDWRDGVGDRDRRPPRKNPAWTGVEHNDFGMDEFMTFCRLLGAEPYIAVNSGLGDVSSAVEQLQYVNGLADTPMGRRRAENGHAEPYRVRWWGIGNEMYGNWQLGHMSQEQYIRKHNRFAEAMRAEDPSVQLVAVGATGPWSEGMMQGSADHMDLISEHFYCAGVPGLSSHVRQMSDAVKHKADAHRDYRRRFDALQGKDITIALDEWNYWYGPHVFGELGTRYFLKDALGVAAALHECMRQSDLLFMANYAQTVNVIGCIKTTKTDAGFAATALPLKLYRRHFGVIPLAVTTRAPLDAAAALSEDRRTLTLGIVNPTPRALSLPLAIEGASITGAGRRWEIAGDDPLAYNQPGEPPRVQIETTALDGIEDQLSVAPCSVTLFALPLK